MGRLPVVSGRELIAALAKIGYEVDRQKGSHVVLRQAIAPYRRITVPDHKEVAKGTLRAILRQAGVSPESLDSLL